MFGNVVPDITTKIMRASVHLKPVTHAETFSGLDILRMHDQYAIGRFGLISAYRALMC